MTVVFAALFISSVVYYFVFSIRADLLVESQSREINKQIVLNYESYIESIIETAEYIQLSSVPLDLRRDYDELLNLYTLNSQVKKDVTAICLFDDKGRKILGDRMGRDHENFAAEMPWFLRAVDNPGIFHFVFDGTEGVSANRYDEVISAAKQVSYRSGGEQQTGVLLIELNFQVIRDLARKTNLGISGHIMIIDEDDSVVYDSERNGKLSEETLEIASEQILGGRKAEVGSQGMFINISTLSNTRWRIVTLINVDEINAIRRNMLSVLLIIFAASLIFSALPAGLVSMRISRPLRELQRIMRRIEEGNISTEVNVSGQREIVMLGDSFNSMITRVRELMNRLVDEQREKRKTELRALQNQINPHFLYNSLDSIVWLAENNRSEEVITAVIALARFFRIGISRGETFIPVRDEIEHVRSYLTIQSIRYADKFRCEFDIEDGLLQRRIMKLILQPLVENAIRHGIDEADALITIRGRLEASEMVFEVINSGYGLTALRIREIHESLDDDSVSRGGLGLKNVNQRLKLHYGAGAGIRISSRPDVETAVTVRIPIGSSKSP